MRRACAWVRAAAGAGALVVGALAVASCGSTVVVTEGCDGHAIGDEWTEGCQTCTCVDAGATECVGECGDGCTVGGQFFAVGESFPAGDDCNQCRCDAPEQFSCTNMACGCPGDPPPCPSPGPGCSVELVCDGTSWGCAISCDGECDEEPPPCPAPPKGCFWTGPFCEGDTWTCGDLVCEECGDVPPDCPQPVNPNCYADALCEDVGWVCQTYCPDGGCEEVYPEGYEQAILLIVQTCGCEADSPCLAQCGNTEVCPEGSLDPAGPCGSCIQQEAKQTGVCVTDAVFGRECQSSFECSAFLDCVLSGG